MQTILLKDPENYESRASHVGGKPFSHNGLTGHAVRTAVTGLHQIESMNWAACLTLHMVQDWRDVKAAGQGTLYRKGPGGLRSSP